MRHSLIEIIKWLNAQDVTQGSFLSTGQSQVAKSLPGWRDDSPVESEAHNQKY